MAKYHFDTDDKTRKRMSQVHTKSGIDEVVLAKALWKRGVRYQKNYDDLPGKPDIAITKYKIAVFVDGEFWHGKDWPDSKKYLHRNRDYWIKKIEQNIAHDLQINQKLKKMGWTVLRYWSRDVVKNPDYYAELICWQIRGVQEDKTEQHHSI